MSGRNDLYQQVILDHNKNPRNFKVMQAATHECDGHNPLCGDQIRLYVKKTADGTIEDISFNGNGCAISKSSASLMTVAVKGKAESLARQLFSEFHKMVTGELDPETVTNQLGKLTIFSGVREYPSRIKCASLSWHALLCALDKQDKASTE